MVADSILSEGTGTNKVESPTDVTKTNWSEVSIEIEDKNKRKKTKWKFGKNDKDKNAKKEKSKEVDEKEEDEFTLPPVRFGEIFKYTTKHEKMLMSIGVTASVLAGLCMPAMIILFGNITNAFVYEPLDLEEIAHRLNITVEELEDLLGIKNFLDEVTKFGLGTFIIGIIQFILGYLFVWSLNSAAESQVYRLRGMFLRSILRQEIGWFDVRSKNDFASRVTEDLNKFQDGIGEKIGMFIFFFVTFIASIINAFVHGWELTLVILSVFPLLAISTGILTTLQSSYTTIELREYAKAGCIAEEVISAVRTVAAFGGETLEVERYDKNLIFAKNVGVKKGLIAGIGLGFMWLIIYASYSLAFWYGTKLILDSRPPDGNNEYDPSKLIVVFFSVLMGAMNVGQSAPYMEAFNIARGAASTIFDIIERKSLIDASDPTGKKLPTVKGNIEFRNVSFNYPARHDVQILRGLSLTIRTGQTVALVGPSGCGKSTCIQLIQRFYDPASGSVTLDNEDIRELNIGWLRDQIGVVGQEPVLFATTIEENIRYGHDDATFDDIVRSAKEANAHDFIMQLAKKYKTHVGERGVQLSGGQKQRIAIARALIKQPKILLLDEATSALDNQSEALVQKALDKVRKGRTTVIVAHRLSTIRTADSIVVFKDGSCKEKGTHSQLMNQKGLYYTLVTAQLTDAEKTKMPEEMIVEHDDEYFEEQISIHSDEIIENITSCIPMALTRTPSARHSLRRRRTTSSSSSSASTKLRKISEMVEDEEEVYPPVPMKEILKKNATEWPYILMGIVGATFQGICMPAYAILFGEVLGTLSITAEDEAREQANFYAVLFLVVGVIAAASIFIQSYSFSLAGEILTRKLRKEAFTAMLEQEIGYFDEEKHSVGALCSRLSGDASAVQGATGSRIGTVVQAIVTLVTAVGLSLYFEWRLGLVTLPFIPFVLIAIYFQAKILMGQTLTESKVLEDAGKIAIEAISNIRTVASLHKEEYFAKEYSKAMLASHEEAMKKSHIRGLVFGFANAIPFIAYAVVMFYGGYLVEYKGIDYENVFKVAEALILGTMMVGQTVAFAPNYNKAKVAAARLFALLNRRPLIDTSPGVGLRLSGPVEEIKTENVHFSYPSRPHSMILNGLNLMVIRGRTLALVGSSGCGKSTVISLLERFYDPTSGIISLNSEDIQKLNVGYVRNQLGLVSQEPILFDKSIEENIAYGDTSRTAEHPEIINAAKQANIHDFIISLPEGYNTRVGTKGTQLSGGQKQRIAIARSLLRNPGVLLLDEATSALDTESEKVVQEALDKAQEGRTSIVIAHRLSTIKGADAIAVVQGGKIVEIGTHKELMDARGHYYDLYQTNQ